MIVGAYHIVSARHNLLPSIRASVWGRVAFAVLLASLVVASVMPMALLLFAAIDLGGAAWTAIALRQAPAPGPAASHALEAAGPIVLKGIGVVVPWRARDFVHRPLR